MVAKRAIVVLGFVLLLVSCATIKISDENIEYSNTANISVNFALRGLYSSASYYNDDDYKKMMDSIMDGKVTFINVEGGINRVVVEKIENQFMIKISNVYDKYDDEGKNMYFALLLNMVAKMEIVTGNKQDNEKIIFRTFDIIKLYSESGMNTGSLLADEWFKNKQVMIEGATIK